MVYRNNAGRLGSGLHHFVLRKSLAGSKQRFLFAGTTLYVITRSSNITTTRLVFIRLHFHAVLSRLLLSPWHSNDPEPKIHLFVLESKPQFCPTSCARQLPTSSTHHIPPTITYAQSLAGCLCNKKAMSLWACKQRVPITHSSSQFFVLNSKF